MIISVVGEASASPEIESLAERVGSELARRGATLVCGGGPGVMAAACRGAKSAGGTTVGILSSPRPDSANPWVDIPIPTGLGQGRNVIIARSGGAVIAIGGRYGTLSEIGHALKAGVPVIGVNTWTLSKNGQADDAIITSKDAVDAVDKALAAAERRELVRERPRRLANS